MKHQKQTTGVMILFLVILAVLTLHVCLRDDINFNFDFSNFGNLATGFAVIDQNPDVELKKPKR